jgi:hypothetical protein
MVWGTGRILGRVGVGLPNCDSAVPKGSDLGVLFPSVIVNYQLPVQPQSHHVCVTESTHDAFLAFAAVRNRV